MLSSRAMTKTVDRTRCLWGCTDLGLESSLADYLWAFSGPLGSGLLPLQSLTLE